MLPILFQRGSVTIYTHDAFTVLGLLAGLVVYYRALGRERMLEPRIVVISLAALVGGAIGARLITAWEHLPYYAALGEVPFTYVISHSGKSILGGLVGGYLATVLAKRALAYTASTGDYYAAAVPLGLAIGRIGCFLSELPLGTPTSLPWAMTVSPEAASAFARCPGCDGPMHPSMLYEIGFNLVALAAIVRYRGLIPVRGDTLKAYLLAYAVFRFGVEFVRGNELQFAGLTGPQLVLIPLTALLVAHFVRQFRRGVYHVPEPPPVGAVAVASSEA
ncbi:MAG: prolipoprotein diacylglyceryl transferase [Chloroflexota bacterium]|nr:prolipoprotein diacylglyceryl transferase [Chloroflexota bacterium]